MMTLQAALILDVPSPEYIPSLMESFTNSPFFHKYRSRTLEERKEHPVHAVFHLCGEGVLQDERYKAFMNGFSDETHVRPMIVFTPRMVFLMMHYFSTLSLRDNTRLTRLSSGGPHSSRRS